MALPTKGFSSLTVECRALYDADSYNALIDALKKELDPEIEIIEVNIHMNSLEFAKAVVDRVKNTPQCLFADQCIRILDESYDMHVDLLKR